MPIIRDYCYEHLDRNTQDHLLTITGGQEKNCEIIPPPTEKNRSEKYPYSSHGVVSFPFIPGKMGTVQIIFIISSPVFMNM